MPASGDPHDGDRAHERERSPRRLQVHPRPVTIWAAQPPPPLRAAPERPPPQVIAPPQRQGTAPHAGTSASSGAGGAVPGAEAVQVGGGAGGGIMAIEDVAALEVFRKATREIEEEGILNEQLSITCDLPTEKVSALIGKGGRNLRQLQSQTGTHIHFEPVRGATESQQTLLVSGPLLGIYKAHALLMTHYHAAIEAPVPVEINPAAKAKVEELSSQVKELQTQLLNVQAKVAREHQPQAQRRTPPGGKGKNKAKNAIGKGKKVS
eukprot:NODE_7271_length_1594_cov_6.260395.p2 GENE.NODE_7271_length_1594_cov_6.260395~~NODE_7271_length_1594_cov_6.260395.p2  ORF type:complete len:265 (-),score=79.04 NODE_7271_length_1594_cov_6.260395:201-995(-)